MSILQNFLDNNRPIAMFRYKTLFKLKVGRFALRLQWLTYDQESDT